MEVNNCRDKLNTAVNGLHNAFTDLNNCQILLDSARRGLEDVDRKTCGADDSEIKSRLRHCCCQCCRNGDGDDTDDDCDDVHADVDADDVVGGDDVDHDGHEHDDDDGGDGVRDRDDKGAMEDVDGRGHDSVMMMMMVMIMMMSTSISDGDDATHSRTRAVLHLHANRLYRCNAARVRECVPRYSCNALHAANVKMCNGTWRSRTVACRCNALWRCVTRYAARCNANASFCAFLQTLRFTGCAGSVRVATVP